MYKLVVINGVYSKFMLRLGHDDDDILLSTSGPERAYVVLHELVVSTVGNLNARVFRECKLR